MEEGIISFGSYVSVFKTVSPEFSKIAYLFSVLLCHVHGPGLSLTPTALKETLVLSILSVLFASLPLSKNNSNNRVTWASG